MNPVMARLQAEVEQAMAERKPILCIVMTDADYQAMTGKDPLTVQDDFGSFLGIPIRLGDGVHKGSYVRIRKPVNL